MQSQFSGEMSSKSSEISSSALEVERLQLEVGAARGEAKESLDALQAALVRLGVRTCPLPPAPCYSWALLCCLRLLVLAADGSRGGVLLVVPCCSSGD